MIKKIIKIIGSLSLCAVIASSELPVHAAAGAGAGTVFPVRFNDYSTTAVSAQLTEINGNYFIADTYHDRILYVNPRDLGGNLMSCKVMADDFNKPHSICSDGKVFLVTDTDNNRVATYIWYGTGEFVEIQSFENVGVRPHYCVYDKATSRFYVWSSYTGEMYIYGRSPRDLKLTFIDVKKVAGLAGVYTRAFTIDGNDIILASQGAGGIIVVDKNTFKIKASYVVPDEIGGIVQVARIGSHYYLTTSADRSGNQNNAMTVRSSTLAGFMSPATYEDVTASFGGIKGVLVPYYITESNGRYYVRMTALGAGLDDKGVVVTEDPAGNLMVTEHIP